MLAIVTPGGLAANALESHVAAALDQLAAGSCLVLLRDQSLERDHNHQREQRLGAICAGHAAELFVHGDLVPSAAANIHLPDRPGLLDSLSSLRAENSKRQLSASCHSSEAAIAAAELADVVYLGPIWPTPGKPNAIGIAALAAAKNAWGSRSAALFAIGGIVSASRANEARAAGADGVAGIRCFGSETIRRIAESEA